MNFDLDAIRKVLAYDKNTGQFTFSVSGPNRRAGRVAGHVNKVNGYVEVGVQGRKVYGHRLAWLMAYGHFPQAALDHINGVRSDNRIANLRLAHGSINSENVRSASSNGSSGFLGVTFCRQTKRWIAQITVSHKHKTLGRFDTPELAHEAYLKAKRSLHVGCTL